MCPVLCSSVVANCRSSTVQGFVDEFSERSASTKFKGALCYRHRTGSGE